eukprot:COSAG02_NODE_46_length_45443_cov_36.731497_34_plen_78_part_00
MSGASCSCFCYHGNSHSIENYGPKNSHATCANFWRDDRMRSASESRFGRSNGVAIVLFYYKTFFSTVVTGTRTLSKI